MGLGEQMQAGHPHPVTCGIAGVFLRVQLEVQRPELQVQGPGLLALPGHLRVACHTLANSNRWALPSMDRVSDSQR